MGSREAISLDKDERFNRSRQAKRFFLLGLLVVIALGGALLSIVKGAVYISPAEVWRTLVNQGTDAYSQVIWNIRLPRTIVGALVGCNLAVAGAILQAVMRNPLADPHIIGISAGAGLAGVAVMILYPELEALITPGAFIGAMLAAAAIYSLAWKGGIRPVRMILAGVAVSAFLGSGISALMIFYSDRVHGALMWMVGGLSARSWPHVAVIWPYTVLGGLLAYLGAARLNLLQLGDDTARGLGLDVEMTRTVMTAVAALLAASAVSVAGLLGFVGLIVPHAARLLIGSDYRFLLPASALLGMGVVMLSDTLARIMLAPVELPVGIIMAFAGAPFFLYLLRREM
ncbi:FecCD family ABC transporter permease [Propionispora vibrioides]|uniref:Iron complex transport system permease protein n=1 Tax=Propionispora vibrioides TaxID=112903 RepID=A0A1H8X6F5_9FIRM|nr:iron ABC transporter permease [Propionispora vibrioides]SEP35267.1 iron complex transport system permease protein [Propionispora vibrioides]